MTELHLIRGTDGRSVQGNVIFVHGLGGDPFNTWRCDTGADGFWPEWLARDMSDVAVHTLSYDASPTGWLGATMPLTERAPNVLTELQTRELGEAPIVFICHSLGGLLVKQLLRHAMEMQNDAWRRIAWQTEAVVFLATPHRGSNVATFLLNVVKALGALGAISRMSATVKELEANVPALQDLNSWYINNSGKAGIATYCFYEKQSVKGVVVVDELSGRLELPGADPIAIDADHFSICKPASPDAFICRRIAQIVREATTSTRVAQSNLDRRGSTEFAIRERPIFTSASRPKRVFLSYRNSRAADEHLVH